MSTPANTGYTHYNKFIEFDSQSTFWSGRYSRAYRRISLNFSLTSSYRLLRENRILANFPFTPIHLVEASIIVGTFQSLPELAPTFPTLIPTGLPTDLSLPSQLKPVFARIFCDIFFFLVVV